MLKNDCISISIQSCICSLFCPLCTILSLFISLLSVSNALDEAATALNRMRSQQAVDPSHYPQPSSNSLPSSTTATQPTKPTVIRTNTAFSTFTTTTTAPVTSKTGKPPPRSQLTQQQQQQQQREYQLLLQQQQQQQQQQTGDIQALQQLLGQGSTVHTCNQCSLCAILEGCCTPLLL